MDDFANILHRDYGLKPQGKSAPMTSSKPGGSSPFSSSSPSSGSKPKNGSNHNSRSSNPVLDEDFFFGSLNGVNTSSSVHNSFGSAAPDMPAMYDDVFGGPPKYASPSYPPMTSSAVQQTSSSQSYDDIFRIPVKPSSSTSTSSNKDSSFPVFDAPLYDDDIFGGVPGIRSTSVVYDDVFSGGSTVGTGPSVLEDLLGVSENRDRSSGSQQPIFDSSTPSAGVSDFDDLIPGFGGTEPAKPRPTGEGKPTQHTSSGLEKDFYGMSSSDPFDVLQGVGVFNVPQSVDQPSASPFPDSDASKGPTQSSGSHHRHYSNSGFDENIDASGNSSPQTSTGQSPSYETRQISKSKHSSLNSAQTYATVIEENHSKHNQSSSSQVDEQTWSSSSPKPQHVERGEAQSFHSPVRRKQQTYDDFEDTVRVPKVVENRQADEFWISVEDVKLVTEPTGAPPPSRRPPLPGLKHATRAAGSKAELNRRPSSRHESPQSAKLSSSRGASEQSNRSNLSDLGNVYDDLDEFASGVSRARNETKMDMSAPTLEEEIMEGSAAATASAIAMKEAMERARSKLRDHEKEERESGLKVEETQEDLNEAKEEMEEKAREQEQKERARERDEREREAKVLRAREEREKRHREREELERKREREKDRIAVERATQEARERAERAAVERANAEARERAAAEAKQRAAVERATAEARERAAAEARERAAVERATAEARERAAAEAREKAAAEARERAAAERAAVERAAAEVRERAAAEAREKAAAEARERAASERAAAEARERAAAEARERAAAERVASEAREKAAAERAASEARSRAERAFVERVQAEARERAAEKAAAQARERAERAASERASAAREQQRRSENDLESFFASNSRPGSAPRQRSPAKATTSQPSKGFATEGSQRSSSVSSAVRKVTPTTLTDDWTSLFGPTVSTAGEFQEVEGESVERRQARLDRHLRTVERAARALDEKNQRDLQAQKEQAERHRAGEMLDAEIKRWAAGKEGNLRALLSTLQYVLWPECGWQAVSLTDLITAAAVKKVYRKATLCVHPDKVQQKGATIQQKYIAEKVFDLLKEAWNKFNSEELF